MKKNYRPLVIFLILCLAFLLWLLHYAPFYAPSYLFWTGVLVVLAGLISFIKPIRFLLIHNRKIALAVCGFGLLMSIIPMFWPVKPLHISQTESELDKIMPKYSFWEYHETKVNASPKEVMTLVEEVSVTDLPVVKCLLSLRETVGGKLPEKKTGKKPKGLQEMRDGGFLDLISDSTEFIMGMIGQPQSSKVFSYKLNALQFMAFEELNYVKIAFNFKVKDLGNGQSLLSTETRVQTFDNKTAKIFNRYWTIVYPGSAIIRRVWLNAIADRAENN